MRYSVFRTVALSSMIFIAFTVGTAYMPSAMIFIEDNASGCERLPCNDANLVSVRRAALDGPAEQDDQHANQAEQAERGAQRGQL